MTEAYSSQFLKLCDQFLAIGIEELRLSKGNFLAIVSRIQKDDYTIVAVKSTTDAFVAGESFPLLKTFCSEVVSKKKTVAMTELDGCLGLSRHPLYHNVPLEGYIGTPIFQEGEVWGTLNFSSLVIRREPFNEDDIAFVENASNVISEYLSCEDSKVPPPIL